MLPDMVLEPNQVYLLHCGDAGFLEENYIGFQLDNKSGTIVLSHNGKIVEQFKYENLANGLAKVRLADGRLIDTSVISPGYENTDEGVEAFQTEFLFNKNSVSIFKLFILLFFITTFWTNTIFVE